VIDVFISVGKYRKKGNIPGMGESGHDESAKINHNQ
jgi:hypothetical protein